MMLAAKSLIKWWGGGTVLAIVLTLVLFYLGLPRELVGSTAMILGMVFGGYGVFRALKEIDDAY